MRLYHGSPVVVAHPQLELCRAHNDYGPGFYCTEDEVLAKEWACNKPGRNGYCNVYELDESGLAFLDLDQSTDGVLSWLAVLMEHRLFDLEWNAANVKQRFVERFRVDLSQADVVCGYRADDSYFSIARAFVSGAITDEQAACALRLGDLGRQVVLRTSRAFSALRFIGASEVFSSEWYPRWEKRDFGARLAFREMRSDDAVLGGRRIFELLEDGGQ